MIYAQVLNITKDIKRESRRAKYFGHFKFKRNEDYSN